MEMIDVLIIVLIISGFFITYILVLVCYWWTKEKNAKNAKAASNNVQVEWPSEPLEMNLANVSEISVPHAMEVGISSIPTVAIEKSDSDGDGGDDGESLASGLYISSFNTNGAAALVGLRNFTILIHKTEIIIVDDILNKSNGDFGLYKAELAFDYTKGFLDMTYDNATKVLEFKLEDKPQGTNCAGVTDYDYFDMENNEAIFKVVFKEHAVTKIYEMVVDVHPSFSTPPVIPVPSGKTNRICITPAISKMRIYEI